MSSVFSPTFETPSASSAPARTNVSSAGKRTVGSRGPATPSRVVRPNNTSAPAMLYQLSDHNEFTRRPSSSTIDEDIEIVDETERRNSKTTSPPPRQVTAAVLETRSASPSSSTVSSSRSISPTTTPPSQVITPPVSLRQERQPTSLPQEDTNSRSTTGKGHHRERPPLMSSHDVESPASPDPPTDKAQTKARQQPPAPERVPEPAPPAVQTTPKPSSAESATLPTTPPRVTLGTKELIGAGSFGSVFKALDMTTNQFIAVKEIRMQHVESTPQAQKELAALEREIRVMQRLDHPNIVKYLGYTRGEGTFNIHMEFVSCGTISSLLKTFGPLQPIQAALFTRQILTGLEYLHGKNIIHRDLKGDNLFVNTDGTLKLGDFGTAKELQTVRQSNSVAGTPYFMAPEVVRNGGHGLEADVWSVGCCVIQMLSGRPPYRNFDNQITVMFQVSKGDIEPQIPKDIPDDAKDFIRTCCKFKPKERPTVTQLLQHPWLLSAPPPIVQRVRTPPPPEVPVAATVAAPRSTVARTAASPPGDAASRAQKPPASVDSTPRNGTPVSENATPPPPPPVASGQRTDGGGSASRGVAAARAARKQQPDDRPQGATGGRRAATPVKKPSG